jgi:hypothetical protein
VAAGHRGGVAEREGESGVVKARRGSEPIDSEAEGERWSRGSSRPAQPVGVGSRSVFRLGGSQWLKIKMSQRIGLKYFDFFTVIMIYVFQVILIHFLLIFIESEIF